MVAQDPRPARKAAAIIFSVAVSLYAAFALREIQFATPHLVSRDGYYHTRYANLLPHRGLTRDFPWMQHSFWKDHFSDKEFLFHVWLAPFCTDEKTMVPRAKFAAWLLAGAVLLAFARALKWTGVRWPVLWAFVLLSSGNHFLYRLSAVRAHVLSILIFIAGTALLLKGRWRWLAAAGFLYSWSYAAPHLLIAIAFAHSVALAAFDRRLEWRGIAAATAGVAAGLVFHPYSPNSLHLWYVQNVVVLKAAWGVGGDLGLHLGDEFDSILPRSLVMASTAVFASLLVGNVLSILAARDRRLTSRTSALLVIAWACFTLYCLSARFIEYLAPACIWLLASAATDFLDPEWVAEFRKRRPAAFGLAAAGLVAALGVLHWRSMNATVDEVKHMRGAVMADASRWTRANVPPGKNIVHLNWGDFVQLFHFDPDHRYINGLDPAFMYVKDERRVRYLEDVRTGRYPIVAHELAEMFDSKTLIVSKEYPRQVAMCENAMLEVLYEDERAVVYSIAAPGFGD